MNANKKIAALFDFDGVIMDTEKQYTIFWNEQGRKYLDDEEFGLSIKGQTLAQIYNKHFQDKEETQQQISADLSEFEYKMSYEYVPGVQEFLLDLHRNGVGIAVVTSSDEDKMENVYRIHPEFKSQFDFILTAGMFSHSKPDPECFLLGMKKLNTLPEDSFVFEDSFHGLQAGMSSGATVIGLATTNSRETIADKAHFIIDNFEGMSFEKLIRLK